MSRTTFDSFDAERPLKEALEHLRSRESTQAEQDLSCAGDVLIEGPGELPLNSIVLTGNGTYQIVSGPTGTPKVEKLDASEPCAVKSCCVHTYWKVDGKPICIYCIRLDTTEYGKRVQLAVYGWNGWPANV